MDIEEKVSELKLTAPRVTIDRINEVIKSVEYHVFDDSCLTICCLTLENGYNVTGESACVSKENFNKQLGEEIAYGNAFNKIWGLEGYLLKQSLFELE